MQPGEPRLVIDYGAACTTAVVAWLDGRWTPLLFDGHSALTNAVHVRPGGQPVVGAPAWQLAAAEPTFFLEAPLRAGAGTVSVDGTEIEVSDLVAASLRQVAGRAGEVLGAVVPQVHMVVPAGWGPRRRTWLRQAAHKAGIGQPTLVEAPVAAADRLITLGAQIPVGAYLLMVDVGTGCEASVLRRGPTGFEVLSTLADPDAGGTRIDELLVGMLVVPHQPGASEAVGSRWTALAAVRAGKEALSTVPAVTVVLPAPAPAVVLTSATVQQVAAPVLERAADLASKAVTAADLTVDQVSGVYLVGAAASTPPAAAVIGHRLQTAVQVLPDPGTVAVLGAAHAGAHQAGAVPAPVAPEPPVRRALALALPGVASLVLIAHFLFSASFHNGTRRRQYVGYYVLMNNGELALACLFAVITCLSAGALFGAGLSRTRRADAASPNESPGDQVGNGVLAAAVAGLAISGLYAGFSALYFVVPMGSLLRWALVPVLPIAVIAVVVAFLAARRLRAPVHGWDAYLAFPMSAVVTAGAGMLLVQYSVSTGGSADTAVLLDLAGRVGGMLLGVGAACALVSNLVLRLVLGVPLGLFVAVIVSPRSTGAIAVIVAVAVMVWWARRLWDLVRSPVRMPVHAG